MKSKINLKVGIAFSLLIITFLLNLILAAIGAGYILNSQGIVSTTIGFLIYLCITILITLICIIIFIRDFDKEEM